MTTPLATAGPDAGLLAAVARGEPDALDAWYRREHPVVHRLCFGFLADGTEADDAAQDAMLHLLDRLPRHDENRPYVGWRNTVVLNLCRDRLRRRGARARAEDRAPPPTAPLPRPEDVASARELRALLQDALSELSPREREAFVLRDLEGRPTPEVASSLGVLPSSVRSLVTLARRRLRARLGASVPELVGEERTR